MKNKVIKAISLLLIPALVFGLLTPALAESTTMWISQSRSDIPIIRISGDGEKLVDENGEKVFHYKDILSLFKKYTDDEDGTKKILESVNNVLLPWFTNGLLFNNWQPFYDNLQKEVGDMFEHSLLDADGNPQYGTGIRPERAEKMEKTRHNDQGWIDWGTPESEKYYVQDRYWFYYDWRLDPLETAEDFKLFIDDILASTGCSQAGIIATCLGTNVVTAYLALYPEHAAAHIRGIAFDGSVTGGAEMLSEPISGKFNVDLAAINRTLYDCDGIGLFSVDEFINLTLEMADRSGFDEAMLAFPRYVLYPVLFKGITSALALSTFYTWPNYWACVSKEDYPYAMEYVFGPEGSEKRAEYAGLIEKIENYNTLVRQRVPEILQSAVDSGIHFGVVSKYGFQILPVCKTNDLVSDQFASVGRSSFGATVSTIYKDLPDEYLAAQREAGLGDYLSPDGQIDASTCLFPESTWFIKNSNHSNWSDWELRLLYDIASSKEQVTVENGCWPSRFVVYSYTDPDERTGGEIEAMSAENCDTEHWEANEEADRPANFFVRLRITLIAWVNWNKALFQKIFK